MFIEPIECNICHRKGRPGADFHSSSGPEGYKLHCECGNKIELLDPKDQCVLSENIFVRLGALSNHSEGGFVQVMPGSSMVVTFTRPFEYPCRVFLTPKGHTPIYAKEAFIENDKMLILVGAHPDSANSPMTVEVFWTVYGLVSIDSLPTWYVHFYSAVTQLANGLFKPALIDYATSFEVFVESYLNQRLAKRFGAAVSDHLLRKTWRIDERCKELLELATGHRLTERDDVYSPWDRHVRVPRNNLSHGAQISVNRTSAEDAHQATCQAIRWIQSFDNVN